MAGLPPYSKKIFGPGDGRFRTLHAFVDIVVETNHKAALSTRCFHPGRHDAGEPRANVLCHPNTVLRLRHAFRKVFVLNETQ